MSLGLSKTPLHSESDCFILLTWWHLAGASLGDLAFLHRERHSSIKYCEGVGTWVSYSNKNSNEPWGSRWTLPYHVGGTAKSRPSSRRP